MDDIQDAKGLFRALFDFNFSTLITTRIIKALYVIITIAVSLLAWIFLLASLGSGGPGAIFGLIFAPLGWLLYMIAARISLEIVIVVFRMGEDVHAIAAGRGGEAPGRPPQL